MSLLVISQDSDLLNRCRQIASCPVETAANAKEARAMMEGDGQYSLVLNDTRVPGTDPIALLHSATTLCGAVTLLLAPPEMVPPALDLVNRHGFFKLLPSNIPLEDLNSVVEQALVQYRLQACALSDPLTGARTSHGFLQQLNTELQRSVRYTHFLSLIHCSIDHLEDLQGKARDQALRSFVSLTEKLLREGVDWISRWHDDSFFIVLPETPLRGAGKVATRLCEQVAARERDEADQPHVMTASFAVTGYSPEDRWRNSTIRELMQVATACLRQTSEEGGNRVLCCP